MGLHQFERRLERLVEGVFAKASRSGLQPVELARRLTRTMDAERTLGVRGTVAPNHFTFVLSSTDANRFASFRETLIAQLADAAREHARDEDYRFMGPVTVEIDEDEGAAAGTFLVSGEIVGGPGGVVGSLLMEDGSRLEVGEDPVTIGRMPDCD